MLPRFNLWCAAAPTVLTAILCFVPLFNRLGYEYNLALGWVAVFTGHVIGVKGARLAPGTLAAFGKICAWSILHLIPALALITANALRVRNCDYWEGLGFFLLMPVSTTIYSATLGLVATRVVCDRRQRWQWLLSASLLAAPLFVSLWRLYTQPPIFAYDHLWGYFAGSLYDEAIGITSNLLWLRIGTAFRIIVLLSCLWLWASQKNNKRLCWLTAGLASCLVAGWESQVGKAARTQVDRRAIEEALPVVIERPGLEIRLPKGIHARTQQAIALDHAFRLAQIQRRLGLDTKRTIRSYVYKNAAEKGKWMGGQRTMVAKPWLGEIHIHGIRTNHPVLAHELVHALAADLVDTPLRVPSWYGFLPNLVLVEGLAEALTVGASKRDLHIAAKVMRSAGLAPDLRTLMHSGGFWSQAPSRAYTLAGSFVRFLHKNYGIQELHAVYQDGDFEAAYRQPLDDLVSRWETFVDSLEVPPRERHRAIERFRVPSVFRRPCPHVVAQLRANARRANAHDAVTIVRRVCEFRGNTPSAKAELAAALLKANKRSEYVALSKQLLETKGLSHVQRRRLYEGRGQLFWQNQSFDQAHAMFTHAAALQTDDASDRLQWVRLWAIDQPPDLRRQLRLFLTNKAPLVVSVIALVEAAQKAPKDATLPYLIARQLHQKSAWREALRYLAKAHPHPFPPIEAERRRLIADCTFRLGMWTQAHAAYQDYSDVAPSSGDRARALDWLERIAFLKQASR